MYIYSASMKFRYFEKYKISFKNCSVIHDSGQQQNDVKTFNSSNGPGTMVLVQHVQSVIFEFFKIFTSHVFSCL